MAGAAVDSSIYATRDASAGQEHNAEVLAFTGRYAFPSPIGAGRLHRVACEGVPIIASVGPGMHGPAGTASRASDSRTAGSSETVIARTSRSGGRVVIASGYAGVNRC